MRRLLQYNPNINGTVAFEPLSLLFGGSEDPQQFSRFPAWVCFCLAVTLAVGAQHCVDDLILIEEIVGLLHGWTCWRILAMLLGWDVPDSKSPLPSQLFTALGIQQVHLYTPEFPVTFQITAKRKAVLRALLEYFLNSKRIGPSDAGSLASKLGFATTSMFGRVGRALLRALYRRQHEKRWNWNVQLEYTFRWRVEAIYTALPREVPLRLTDAPRAVSYSDGEGADAGVDVALWLPGYPVPMAAFMETPRELRMLWARQLQQSAALGHDIFEIEAIGPLIVLSMWGHLMHGMLWTHYIDNTGAQAALVKGSSSVDSATILAAHFWSAVAAASIHAWLDRVASESNPVDALSRKDNRGPWRRVELAWLPDKFLAELRAYLFG